MATDLQKSDGKSRLEAAIDSQRTQIEQAASRGWDIARQLDILTMLARNPKLQECVPDTVISCVVAIARRGLSLNPALGHAHLIPRWNKKAQRRECTWQIGYQGYRHLLHEKAGMVKILAQVVRPGEEFSVDYFNEMIVHRTKGIPGPADQLIAAYSVGVFEDGSKVWRLLWRDEIDLIMNRALAREKEEGEFSPWKSDYPAMARKTAIRALGRAIDLPEDGAEALRASDDDAIEAEWHEEPPKETPPQKQYAVKEKAPAAAPKAQEKAAPKGDLWEEEASEYLEPGSRG